MTLTRDEYVADKNHACRLATWLGEATILSQSGVPSLRFWWDDVSLCVWSEWLHMNLSSSEIKDLHPSS